MELNNINYNFSLYKMERTYIIPKGTIIYHSSYSKLVDYLHPIQWFSTSISTVKYFISNKDIGRIYSYIVDEDIYLYDNSDSYLTHKLMNDNIIPKISRGRGSILDICSQPVSKTIEYKTYPKHLEEYQRYILDLLKDYDGILDYKDGNVLSFVTFYPSKISFRKLEYSSGKFLLLRELTKYEKYRDVPRDIRNSLQTFMIINHIKPDEYMQYLKDNIQYLYDE